MDDQPARGGDEGNDRLLRLLEQRRFRELRGALDERMEAPLDVGLDDGAERSFLLGLRGELAWRGHGPASDAVLAALTILDELEQGEQLPPLVARAAQAAARAGAAETAGNLLDRALQARPDDDRLRFVRAQLDSGHLEGHTREQWRVEGLLARGERDEAVERLSRLVEAEQGTVEERRHALLRLADMRRLEGRFDEAARHRHEAVELYPEAEDAVLLRLAGALELWASGDAAAVERLRALRRHTKDGRRAGERYAYQVAGDVLDVVDRLDDEEAPAPGWITAGGPWHAVNEASCPGRSALVLLEQALDLDGEGAGADEGDHPLPTMAHLRHALSGLGVATARLRPDADLMQAALAGDALLLFEEERSTETGFLLLVGYEPVAGLLLLKDPRRLAPLLRSAEDQRGRSALHGGGALLITGPGEEGRLRLEALGAVDDEHLDLVDRCNLDERGRVPAQARIASLAEHGITVAPDLPMLHRRHGESLLEQVRMGNVEFGPAGPFERWLATARHSFPDAEWPFQIYARALEMQERYDEAGIAWSDAMNLDPRDERNIVGQARVLGQQGRTALADQMLRRALTLRQDQPMVLARRAELALSMDRITEAGLYAAMATEMDPEDLGARMSLASVEERSGRPEGAFAVLESVAQQDADHVPARSRLLHHRIHRGEWEAAGELAEQIRAMIPGYGSSWETSAWVAWGSGQAAQAMDLCITGFQRCGPEAGLLEMTVQVLATSLPEEQKAGVMEQLIELLAATPSALLDLATGLGKRRWYDEAVEVAELARRLLPRDPNPTWRLIQILLGQKNDGEDRGEVDEARIDALLAETVEGAGPFPFPRVILAWRVMDDDPERALALLAEANFNHAPGPVWATQARALERLGQQDEAAQVWARLPETFPGGVLESMGLLAELGFDELCEDLLRRVLEQMPDCHEASVELARLRGITGDPEGRLALLLEVEAEDESVVPLPMLLDSAVEAGGWEVVKRSAEQILERVELNSRSSYDAWPVRAKLAGACLALGDGQPRERVLRLAPRHPGALKALVDVERRLEHPALDEDLRRLREAAPGYARMPEDRS